MYCTNCGNEINDTASFCAKCGVPIGHGSVNTALQSEFAPTPTPASLSSPSAIDISLIAAKQRCLYAAIIVAILTAPLAVVAMNIASVPLLVLTQIVLFFRSIFSIYAILGLMRALSFRETTKTVLTIVTCIHFIPAVILMVILDSKARRRISNAGFKINGFLGTKIEPVPSFSGKDTLDVVLATVLMVIYTAIILGPSAIEGIKEGLNEAQLEEKRQEVSTWEQTVSVQDEAEAGDAEAQAGLGLCYLHGVGGYPQNIPESIKWLSKAVESEQPTAMAGLGLCYHNGTGVEQNHLKAKKLLENSVAKGNALGQFLLGTWYFTGDNDAVLKNQNKAVELFRKSAEQDNASAMAFLGFCFRDGIGIERDAEEAVKWLQKSVAQEDQFGQLVLGVCYLTGNGVPKDVEKARELFRKSAAQGNQEAIDILKKLED